MKSLDCDFLLHPAAMTSLDECERDPARAWRVNAAASAELAEWCARRGVRMLAVSTDYVFDGKQPGERAEGDAIDPLSAYGRSKAAGEAAVLQHPGNSVWRVSWVFGPERESFIDQIAARARTGEELSAINDKFSRPTSTGGLVRWIEEFLMAGQRDGWGSGFVGVFHACQSGPPVSWHGMAEAVVNLLAATGQCGPLPVRALHLNEMAAFLAERPRHTAMCCRRLDQILKRAGIERLAWQASFTEYFSGKTQPFTP